LVIILLAGFAIAALGIYLIVIGAVAIFGWLVAVAARSKRATPAQLTVATDLVATAPPPNQLYHVVHPVDPRVFDHGAELESTAKSVFAKWARQLPKAPRDPSTVIQRLALRRRVIGRLTTRLDGRRFVWRSAPYRGRERFVGGRPLDTSSLDAYNPPPDLRSRSSYLSLCQRCGGDGRIECTSCGGAGRVSCASCEGEGKVYGFAKNGARRLLNCKDCKGKATLLCGGCSKGQVECVSCERTGRLEHWLEVEGGARDADIQVEPDGDQTRAFVWGKDGVPASDEDIVKDARVVCSVSRDRQLGLDDLPTSIPDSWRSAHWQGIQARLQPGERIVAQTLTLLEVPSIEVAYALDGKQAQSIELEGLRLLAPPISTDALFTSRARSLKRLAIGLALVPALIAGVYAFRGSYYFKPELAGILLGSVLAAAIIYVVFWHASLGRTARKWLLAAIPPIAASTVLAFLVEPSLSHADDLARSGRLDEAKVELEALGDEGAAQLARVQADLRMRELAGAKTCKAARAVAEAIDVEPQRTQAFARVNALGMAEAMSAISSDAVDGVDAALACLTEAVRTGPEARALAARAKVLVANRCILAEDWECAIQRSADAAQLDPRSEGNAVRDKALAAIRVASNKALTASKTEKDLASRVRLQRTALDLWSRFLVVEGGADPPDIAALKIVAGHDQQALARAEEAARVRREAEEKRHEAEAERRRIAAERAEQRRLAEEERRERASEPKSVKCCDGSLSPSCMCGGSMRGCCSHHGGVCGCE
jgi:hypothetical protein